MTSSKQAAIDHFTQDHKLLLDEAAVNFLLAQPAGYLEGLHAGIHGQLGVTFEASAAAAG